MNLAEKFNAYRNTPRNKKPPTEASWEADYRGVPVANYRSQRMGLGFESVACFIGGSAETDPDKGVVEIFARPDGFILVSSYYDCRDADDRESQGRFATSEKLFGIVTATDESVNTPFDTPLKKFGSTLMSSCSLAPGKLEANGKRAFFIHGPHANGFHNNLQGLLKLAGKAGTIEKFWPEPATGLHKSIRADLFKSVEDFSDDFVEPPANLSALREASMPQWIREMINSKIPPSSPAPRRQSEQIALT